MLRIAVVGAGRIGRRHIELVDASRDSALCAIADPAPESADLAAALGVRWHGDLAALLKEERPDGVILATPNALHVSQALECVRAGVPVLVEKPVATSVEDGNSLANAVRNAGVAVLVGHHRRHSPMLQRVRRALDDGSIGDPVAVVGTALFYKPDAYFTDAEWRRLPGGGPILINLIHAIDDLRYLMGEIVSVQAMASSAMRRHQVEDTVAVTLRFRSGVLGTFLLSDTAASPWSWEQTVGEDPMFHSYPDQDCYRLVGTRGALAVPSMRLWRSGDAPSWESELNTLVLRAYRADPMRRQLAHFEAVIRGAAAPAVSVLDATRTLQATQAVQYSIDRGLELEIDPNAVSD